MIDAIPTWAEVNCWIAMLAIGIAILVYAWLKSKREEERTVTWMRDWEELNIKED